MSVEHPPLRSGLRAPHNPVAITNQVPYQHTSLYLTTGRRGEGEAAMCTWSRRDRRLNFFLVRRWGLQDQSFKESLTENGLSTALGHTGIVTREIRCILAVCACRFSRGTHSEHLYHMYLLAPQLSHRAGFPTSRHSSTRTEFSPLTPPTSASRIRVIGQGSTTEARC